MKNEINNTDWDDIYYRLVIMSFDIDERVDHDILKTNILEVLEMIEIKLKNETTTPIN